MSDERLAAIVGRFNDRAPSYDENAMHRALAEGVAEFADLGGVATVLDIATGTGLVLRALDARQPGLRLVGEDASPGMLAVARERLPRAEFVEGRAEELPAADASVDLAVICTALHLFADPAVVFEEVARVLAPEGRLVTASFAEAPTHRHGAGQDTSAYAPDHEPFRTAEGLAEVAGPAGFVVNRFDYREFDGDRCLLAELAPVD